MNESTDISIKDVSNAFAICYGISDIVAFEKDLEGGMNKMAAGAQKEWNIFTTKYPSLKLLLKGKILVTDKLGMTILKKRDF